MFCCTYILVINVGGFVALFGKGTMIEKNKQFNILYINGHGCGQYILLLLIKRVTIVDR